MLTDRSTECLELGELIARDPSWCALPGVLDGELSRRHLSLSSESDAQLIRLSWLGWRARHSERDARAAKIRAAHGG